jgi:hypothetical protein
MDKKGKFEAGKKKYNIKKYPLQSMKDGSVGRVIPCSADPSQCTPGQTTFISRDVGNVLKRAAAVNAKSRKQTLRQLQTTHSQKITALNKKIASAPPEVKARLQKQRQNMQLKFRLGTAKAEQTDRIQIKNSKSNNWKKKRAELGRQKQKQQLQEKMKKKQIEAERHAAAERKAREDAVLRAARKQKSQQSQQQKSKSFGPKTPTPQQSQKRSKSPHPQKPYKTPYSRPIGPLPKPYKTPYAKPIGPQMQQRAAVQQKPQTKSYGAYGRYSPVRKMRNPGSLKPF